MDEARAGGVSGGRVAVFHAGALGDFVLIWPLVRALMRDGAEVTVVAAASHARLAGRALGVRAVGSEAAWVSGLWREGGAERAPIAAEVVLGFVADGEDAVARRWRGNAARALGAREVVGIGPPGSTSRAAGWQRFDVARLGAVERRENAGGPVVVHIGAGGRNKMWPVARWAEVVSRMRGGGTRIEVIAGEVERERLSDEERLVFARMGGEMPADLEALCERLSRARVVAGNDSGPAHLAAQLGVRTVALFGPTDPAVWSPVGPEARVVRSVDGAMGSIGVDEVALAVAQAAAGNARSGPDSAASVA